MQKLILIANEGNAELSLANSFSVLAKEMLTIPFGDYPHGKRVQKFGREAAEKIANNFHAAGEDLPIYIGHPDDDTSGDRYPDKKAYAWIKNVAVTDKALLLSCKWSAPGEELLSNGHFKWFSPYWGCVALPSKNSVQLVQPVRLISVGLTNQPNIKNIPALVNDAAGNEGDNAMEKSKLIALLALAAEADDAAIETAIKNTLAKNAEAATRIAALETDLANEKTARAADKAAHESALANEKKIAGDAKTAADTALANERKARIGHILDAAVASGKITAAQRPQWAGDLEKDLDGSIAKLANAQPAVSTASKTQNMGARKAEAITPRDKVLALVNERMTKTGEDYAVAFANVKKENAALFAEMKQPAAR